MDVSALHRMETAVTLKALQNLIFFVRGSRLFLLHKLRVSYENLALLCCYKLWDSSGLHYSWTRFEVV